MKKEMDWAYAASAALRPAALATELLLKRRRLSRLEPVHLGEAAAVLLTAARLARLKDRRPVLEIEEAALLLLLSATAARITLIFDAGGWNERGG